MGDFQIGSDEKQAVIEVLDLGRISGGRRVREFEQKWARFIGSKYCVATSLGSGALILSLEALKHFKNLKSGMKVITTPLAYIATSSAISAVGLNPV